MTINHHLNLIISHVNPCLMNHSFISSAIIDELLTTDSRHILELNIYFWFFNIY